MGLRGPASTVFEQLSPQQRRKVDRALVESPTVLAVYESHKLAEAGVSRAAFYRYAATIRWQTRLRYIGDLVRSVAGETADEPALARTGRLFAFQRLVEQLDDEELEPAKVAQISSAIAELNRVLVSEQAEARKARVESAAKEIDKTLRERKQIDPATLAEIREKVVGLI